MSKKKEEQRAKDAFSLEREDQTIIHPAEETLNKEKPQEEDTSKEIISTHDERSQEEGVDEQYGGDAADNRDELKREDDRLI